MTVLRRSPRCGALLPLALTACGSSYEPGIQVELLSHPSGALEQSSAAGVVTVEELSWTSAEVELERCSSPLARAWDWLVPTAHAHGASSPTVQAVPTIVSASAAAPLGALAPPAGRYCAVRYRVAPADGDAVGLQTAPSMLGASLRSHGELAPAGGAGSAWSLESRRSFELRRELELELSPEQLRARLSFGLNPERWRAALSVGWFEELAREQVLIEAFRSAFEVELELE